MNTSFILLQGSLHLAEWWQILFAALPVLLLIVLMGALKVSGSKSALITLGVTVLIAAFAYHYPIADIGTSLLYGPLKAIFPIVIIIIMAIFSYNVLVHTGKMEVIKEQLMSISSDKCVQVLLLTWGFGGLLEGMAGFGTAVAIPAAILIGLGFKPVFAAGVSLIANSIDTGFGAVGTPVLTLLKQAGFEDDQIYQLGTNVVLQLSPLTFIVPFVLLFMTEPKVKAIPKHLLLSAILCVVLFSTLFFTAKYVGAETPAVLGSIAVIITIIIYARIIERKKVKPVSTAPKRSLVENANAWSVYALIVVLIFITCPLSPLRPILLKVAVSIPFDIWNATAGIAKAQSVKITLIDVGLLLFVGAFAGGLMQGAKTGDLFKLLGKVVKQQYKTVITVCALITLSSIMDFSGMIKDLGVALAVTTGSLYPLFSPLIGCVGTFISGSDTSSNILFGKLQAETATLIGVDPLWTAASNTTGATAGKIISPQSIAIATSACGLQGQEGDIMKKTLPYALGYVAIAGLMSFLIPKLFGHLLF